MTTHEERVEDLAAKATTGFFTALFAELPPGTTGDFPPDATMAFEQAAKSAVETILLNVPPKKYFILYEVEWLPTDEGDDAPMDRAHRLEWEDERISGYGLEQIGELEHIEQAVARLREERG